MPCSSSARYHDAGAPAAGPTREACGEGAGAAEMRTMPYPLRRSPVAAVVLAAMLAACGARPSTPVPPVVQAAPPRYVTYPMGEQYRGEHEGKAASGHTLRYYTAEERARLEVRPCGGRLCDVDGRPLDPDLANHPERSGTLMYAMTGDGRLYGTFDFKLHVIHHSSLLAGEPAACAGDMLVVDGEVMEVDNVSGHYKPPAEALDQVVKQLRSLGVDLGRTKVNYFGLPDRPPPSP